MNNGVPIFSGLNTKFLLQGFVISLIEYEKFMLEILLQLYAFLQILFLLGLWQGRRRELLTVRK